MKLKIFILILSTLKVYSFKAQDSLSILQKRSFIQSALIKINSLNGNYIDLEDYLTDSVLVPNDIPIENNISDSIKIKEYINLYKKYYLGFGPKYRYIVYNISDIKKVGRNFEAEFYVYKIIPSSANYGYNEKFCNKKSSLKFKTDTLLQKIILNGYIKKSDCKKCSHSNELFVKKCSNRNRCSSKEFKYIWSLKIKSINSLDKYNLKLKINIAKAINERFNFSIKLNDSLLNYNINKQKPRKIFLENPKEPISYKLNVEDHFSEIKTFNSLVEINNNLPKYCYMKNFYTIDVPRHYFRIGLAFDLYKMKKNHYNKTSISSEINLQSSAAFNTWLEYNYYLKIPFIAFCRLGISNTNISLSTSIINNIDVYTSIDTDGHQYNRKIDFLAHSETINLKYINLPLTMGLKVELDKLLKKLNVNNDLVNQIFHKTEMLLMGSYTLMKNYKSTSISTAEINYSGNYPDLFNITMAENGVYDFGTFLLSNSKEIQKINNSINSFAIGITKTISNKLNIEFYFEKKFLHKNLFVEKNNYYISSNSNELNSVLQNIDSFNPKLFSFSLGVSYKLQ